MRMLEGFPCILSTYLVIITECSRNPVNMYLVRLILKNLDKTSGHAVGKNRHEIGARPDT